MSKQIVSVVLGDQVPRRGNTFSAWLGHSVLRLIGWRITGDLANVSKAVMIGAPHTSFYDGLVGIFAMMAVRLDLAIMIKADLFKGVLGRFLRWVGAVPIDRKSPQGVVRQTVRQFKERDGMFLGITPEGTRKSASKWKSGFYHIAMKADVPIIVAVLDYGRKEARLAYTLWPSGDLDADMKKILAYYRGVVPAHPERLSAPLR